MQPSRRTLAAVRVVPAALAFTLVVAASPARAADPASYRTPPQIVADILTAPRVPRGVPNVSPSGMAMVLPELPSLVSIDVLARPVDKLAGLEVVSGWHCTRPQLKSALSGFSIAWIADGRKVRAQLPNGARVGSIVWSGRGDLLACALYAPGGAELWVVDATHGTARRLEGIRLNTVINLELDWMLDGISVVCAVVVPPQAGGATDSSASTPAPAPLVRMGSGKATPQRTARDVLRNADDQRRFARETTAQLKRVPVDGSLIETLGEPSIMARWALSTDDKLVAYEFVDSLPLGVPYTLFPRALEVWNRYQHRIARVGTSPLNDRSTVSSIAPLGPRGWRWGPDGNALWFFSWEDARGVDPAKAIRDTTLPQPGTDRLMRVDAPYTDPPVVVTTSDAQFQQLAWTADVKRLVVVDSYVPRRRVRTWWIDPTEAKPAHHVLSDRSTEGVYDDPGRPLSLRFGHSRVLWTSHDGQLLYLAGDGFRADGQRPFLDALDFDSGKSTRLYESAGDVLEPAMAILTGDAKQFLTLRQSNHTVPNYAVRNAGAAEWRSVSDYADPAPALSAMQHVQFQFTRPDSVRLNAEVVLPAGWKPGTRLPTIFWIYPDDYRSAAAASQNRRAPNRFPSLTSLNPEVLVTQGYAVLYPDLAIVGSNDRYVEEVAMSAKAALDEAARRGYCDTSRVGVGGHSYGAFSTANLLAHTGLFKAGIASDGAYNRTLTPFTFQSEERTLWEATDTYTKMSPFLSATQIKAPLLLMHNLDDTNVGTNPIQSERMFEALSGLGKTVELVQYPYEDHTPVARETVLDYWSRAIEWFDRYVKGTSGVVAPASAQTKKASASATKVKGK